MGRHSQALFIPCTVSRIILSLSAMSAIWHPKPGSVWSHTSSNVCLILKRAAFLERTVCWHSGMHSEKHFRSILTDCLIRDHYWVLTYRMLWSLLLEKGQLTGSHIMPANSVRIRAARLAFRNSLAWLPHWNHLYNHCFTPPRQKLLHLKKDYCTAIIHLPYMLRIILHASKFSRSPCCQCVQVRYALISVVQYNQN